MCYYKRLCVIVVCANDNLKALLTPPSLETTPAPPSNDGAFHTWWNQYLTVPIWVLFLIFPLISIRSPTFFTKFTALGKLSSTLAQAWYIRTSELYAFLFSGTVAIVYILTLTFTKAGLWGVNVDFSNAASKHFAPCKY